MEFEPVGLIEVGRQAQLAQHLEPESALEREVVHRVHRAGQAAPAVQLRRAQVGRGESGMPVVAVHDLRRPRRVEPVGEKRADAAEQGKTTVVVGVGLAGFVGIRVAFAGVERRRVDQVQRHGGAGQRAAQQACAVAQAGSAGDGFRIRHATQDRREGRDQHTNVAAPLEQCAGQGAAHVGETTGLQQRKDLRTDLQHPHVTTLGALRPVCS